MLSKNNPGIGIILLVVGALLLVVQFVDINLATVAWPFFILLPGIALLAIAVLVKDTAAPLAIPGSIVTTIGLILFYQNATGYFESWSYAWGLIVMAVGVGIGLTGLLQANAKLQIDGRRLATVGLILFVAFGAFFELLIFRNFADSIVWRYVLPLGLVAGGLFLLVRRNQEPKELDSPPERQL